MKKVSLVPLAALVACGHARTNDGDSIAVAPKPVVAKPIEIVGDGTPSIGGDVAPFELAIGTTEFCVRIDGRVHCGPADDSVPLAQGPPIGGIEDATSIGLGNDFGCVTTRRGTVHCWGNNTAGQLGAKLRVDRSSDPVQVAGVTSARRVFAGDDHACAITVDGKLTCWGLNGSGETGGSTSWAAAARELVTPTVVPGLSDVTSAALTYRSTCASTKRGEIWCWGMSLNGEQTNVQGPTNENPFRLTSLSKVEDISASSGAVCAVHSGSVSCFGSTYALLPESADRQTASKVANVKDATKIRLGNSHACALTRDARVWCWGYNTNGECGREDPPNGPNGYTPREPAPVEGLPNARDLVASHASSCAITGPEEAWCWGLFPYGGAVHRSNPRSERSPVRLRIR